MLLRKSGQLCKSQWKYDVNHGRHYNFRDATTGGSGYLRIGRISKGRG